MNCEDNEWKTYSIAEIVEVIGGGTPKTSIPDYWNGDIPWLSVVDFNNDNRLVHSTEKTITENGLNNSSTKILKKGQLIISARGTVGALAQVGKDMAFNQSCYGLNTKEGFDNTFLYYLLKQDIESIKRKSHGTVFDTITRDTFKQMFAKIPCLSEQQKIASILRSLDDKIELLQQTNETLEQIVEALFKQWFIDFDFLDENGSPYQSNNGAMKSSPMGLIPEGWGIKKISDFGSVICGKTPSTKMKEYYENGDQLFIKIPDMRNQVFPISTETKISEKGAERLSTKKIPPFSICVSCIATVGLVCLTHKPSFTNQQINSIIPNQSESTFYLYFKMKTLYDQLNSLASGGSATLNLNSNEFSKIKLVAPDETTLRKYDKLSRPFFQRILNNSQQISTLTELRDLLLPRLMSGKVRVPVKEGDEACQA